MILADSVLRKGVRRPNGHDRIVDSLSDIVELSTLKSGDLMWVDERWSWGIELKTPSNVMVSMMAINQETGLCQLDYQMKMLEETYDVPILMVYGVYSSTHDGYLAVAGLPPPEPPRAWRYISVEGKLFSYSMRGIIVVKQPSEQAAAQVIRGLYESSKKGSMPGGLKKARLFGFRKRPDDALRILCGLPGINETLGQRLRARFGSISAIVNASEEELQSVEGIGPQKAKSLWEVCHAGEAAQTDGGPEEGT